MIVGMKKKFKDQIQLFEAIVNNDQQAIKQFYDHIIEPLSGFIRKTINNKEDAEEIAADAFVESLNRIDKCRNLKHLKCYIFIRARFKCQDYHKKTTIPIKPLEDVERTEKCDQDIEGDIFKEEVAKAVLTQINNLDRKIDRQIMLLSLAGIKTSEIALQLGYSEEYVRNRRRKLLKDLRNDLINKKIITVLVLSILQISSL
jgi:RNA polymerase sigma-70 factor (ECF subfamily)